MTLYTIKERRGQPSEWTSANPVLLDGQWGIELGTGKAKLGDGTTAWNDLPYFINEYLIQALFESVSDGEILLLEAGQTAADVPPSTSIGTPVFRKA